MERKDKRGGPVKHERGLTFGWGINDSDYPLKICEYYGRDTNGKQLLKVVWNCPYYARWRHVLARCYSDKFRSNNPTYKDVTCCEQWKYFSNFKRWMEAQDWEGKELDKDLLVKGNREYGPDTCCFLSPDVNRFFKISYKKGQTTSQGVTFRKDCGKYIATCKLLDGTSKYLGRFDTEDEASAAWVAQKRKVAVELAETIPEDKIREAVLNYF